MWAYLMSYVKENRDDKKSAGPILKYNHKNNLGKALNIMKLVAKMLTKKELHYRKFLKRKIFI